MPTMQQVLGHSRGYDSRLDPRAALILAIAQSLSEAGKAVRETKSWWWESERMDAWRKDRQKQTQEELDQAKGMQQAAGGAPLGEIAQGGNVAALSGGMAATQGKRADIDLAKAAREEKKAGIEDTVADRVTALAKEGKSPEDIRQTLLADMGPESESEIADAIRTYELKDEQSKQVSAEQARREEEKLIKTLANRGAALMATAGGDLTEALSDPAMLDLMRSAEEGGVGQGFLSQMLDTYNAAHPGREASLTTKALQAQQNPATAATALNSAYNDQGGIETSANDIMQQVNQMLTTPGGTPEAFRGKTPQERAQWVRSFASQLRPAVRDFLEYQGTMNRMSPEMSNLSDDELATKLDPDGDVALEKVLTALMVRPETYRKKSVDVMALRRAQLPDVAASDEETRKAAELLLKTLSAEGVPQGFAQQGAFLRPDYMQPGGPGMGTYRGHQLTLPGANMAPYVNAGRRMGVAAPGVPRELQQSGLSAGPGLGPTQTWAGPPPGPPPGPNPAYLNQFGQTYNREALLKLLIEKIKKGEVGAITPQP